jgi:hypothetical protein
MIYCIIPTTKERRQRLQKCIDSIRDSVCNEPITICSYENFDGGWVNATHKLIQDINGIVFLLGDDMVLDKDCIQELWNNYENGFLLQPDEQHHRGNLAVSPFCHTDILKSYLFKGYKHLYADEELTEVMKAMGKYKPVLTAKLDHQHFSNNAAPLDETYKLSQSYFDHDRVLFNERKRNNFK